MKRIVVIISVLLMVYGCATTPRAASRFSNYNKTIYIIDTGIVHTPVIADLVVGETKVTGTAEARESVGVQAVRDRAIENALRPVHADILIEPKFEVITRPGAHQFDEGNITVNVIGFPAHYRNFRTVNVCDEEWFRTRLAVPAAVERDAAPAQNTNLRVPQVRRR